MLLLDEECDKNGTYPTQSDQYNQAGMDVGANIGDDVIVHCRFSKLKKGRSSQLVY